MVSCAFSALCVHSKFRHHSHSLGYLYAKFCFFCGRHCRASQWRKNVYWITHSITHLLTQLIWCPGNKVLALRNQSCNQRNTVFMMLKLAAGMAGHFGNSPVPNFVNGCPALQVDLSSWLSLHMSFCKFLSFSELTALTSRSVALAVNSGVTKNCANLYNKPNSCM